MLVFQKQVKLHPLERLLKNENLNGLTNAVKLMRSKAKKRNSLALSGH